MDSDLVYSICLVPLAIHRAIIRIEIKITPHRDHGQMKCDLQMFVFDEAFLVIVQDLTGWGGWETLRFLVVTISRAATLPQAR